MVTNTLYTIVITVTEKIVTRRPFGLYLGYLLDYILLLANYVWENTTDQNKVLSSHTSSSDNIPAENS